MLQRIGQARIQRLQHLDPSKLLEYPENFNNIHTNFEKLFAARKAGHLENFPHR
jgi:hypothetical protein